MKPYSLCVLGNSHTGAFKQAWSNRKPAVAPGFALTFFAASNFHLENLSCRDGALVPGHLDLAEKFRNTSQGKDRIALADYDALVLIGANFGIDVAAICAKEGTVEHLKWKSLKRVYSHACFSAGLAAEFEATLAIKLADQIRSVSNIPVLLCPKPYPSEKLLREPELAKASRFRDAELLGLVVAEAKAVAAAVAARRSCEILWQDEDTIQIPGFTKAEFGLGAVHLNDRKNAPEDDARHMNEEFGFRSLMVALNRLDDISGGRVLGAPERTAKVARA